MNPLNLLKMSRSFRAINDKSEYKSAPKGSLPRFEPSRHPATPEAPAARPELKGWSMVDFCKGWFERIVYGRMRRPAARTTFQAELALEQVKVIRNDLKEDDLEVVVVEEKVGTGNFPTKTLKPDTGARWMKLAARFAKRKPEPEPALAEREP